MSRALLLVANRSAEMVRGERNTNVGNDNISSRGSHTVFVMRPCAAVCCSISGYSAGVAESLTANDGNRASDVSVGKVKDAV